MKKIFKYLGIILSVVMMGAFTSCINENEGQSEDVGLGIKVFFPTKVVAGQPMTINGSGFKDVREIVFPDGVVVTNFEIVSGEMIRVIAPAGIAADGGKIIVRTNDDDAESPVALTLGKTVISGYSKQIEETVKGGEQLTIYGTDLEFISRIELIDKDGNPIILEDKDFYRKGTNSVVITVPKNVFEGAFVGKIYTFDGQEVLMPEFTYEPASEGGGHWEITEEVIWENPDNGVFGQINWDGVYRFALEGTDEKQEASVHLTQDVWDRMKTEKFYMIAQGSDWVQMRIVTGWWNCQWPDSNDITTGNDMIVDNGDGTFLFEFDLAGSDLAAAMDVEHFLLTGGGYTPLKLYFLKEEWIEGGGHTEIVRTSIWKNPDNGEFGQINWDGIYRFALEGTDEKQEASVHLTQDVWDRMKTEPFYLLAQGSDWVQMRIATGWWNFQWPDSNDITTGNERIIDNGDGTFCILIDLAGSDLAANMDKEHFLLTGGGYTPLELYWEEEIWVDGGDSGPKEVVFWENSDPSGLGAINWNGVYRYALVGTDEKSEALVELPQDVWDKMKTQKFYLLAQGSDWVQMRIVTGWWNFQWPDSNDITTGNEMIVNNGDGTFTFELDLAGSDLAANMDKEHFLFTGGGYTPLKLYFKE